MQTPTPRRRLPQAPKEARPLFCTSSKPTYHEVTRTPTPALVGSCTADQSATAAAHSPERAQPHHPPADAVNKPASSRTPVGTSGKSKCSCLPGDTRQHASAADSASQARAVPSSTISSGKGGSGDHSSRKSSPPSVCSSEAKDRAHEQSKNQHIPPHRSQANTTHIAGLKPQDRQGSSDSADLFKKAPQPRRQSQARECAFIKNRSTQRNKQASEQLSLSDLEAFIRHQESILQTLHLTTRGERQVSEHLESKKRLLADRKSIAFIQDNFKDLSFDTQARDERKLQSALDDMSLHPKGKDSMPKSDVVGAAEIPRGSKHRPIQTVLLTDAQEAAIQHEAKGVKRTDQPEVEDVKRMHQSPRSRTPRRGKIRQMRESPGRQLGILAVRREGSA